MITFQRHTALSLTFNSANYGRVYDPIATSLDHYIFPSVGVNSNGDMVVGFSASQAGARISSAFWGRRNGGSGFGRPSLLASGWAYYGSQEFGHYSATIWDPVAANSSVLWTLQEAADAPSISFEAN